jgi:hypothetical protein
VSGARHDEEIQIAAGLRLSRAIRPATPPTHERQAAHQPQQERVAIEEGAAAGFAPPPLVDRSFTAAGKKKPSRRSTICCSTALPSNTETISASVDATR